MISGILHITPNSEILAREVAFFLRERILAGLKQKERFSISWFSNKNYSQFRCLPSIPP